MIWIDPDGDMFLVNSMAVTLMSCSISNIAVESMDTGFEINSFDGHYITLKGIAFDTQYMLHRA